MSGISKLELSFPTAHECSAVAARDSSPPSPLAAHRACARRWGRAHGRCRGVVLAPALAALWPQWQLRLTALRLPLRHTGAALSLPLVCQCLSPSSPALSPSLSCLVSFYRSQPRSRRVEGFALSAQTAATLGRPRTNLPATVLPHGPASLRSCHRRRVEGDPDLHSFSGQKKTHRKTPHDEGRATFPPCFENRREREGREGRRGGKRNSWHKAVG